MVREVASKTFDMAGDGTTTATILAQAIYREGAKLVEAGVNPIFIKERIQNKLTIVRSGLGWIYLIRDSKTTGIVELF